MDVLISLCHQIWHYTILNVSGNEIRISNIALALILSFLGLKYSRYVFIGLKKYLYSKLHNDKDTANALDKILSTIIVALYVISILEIANIPLSSFAFIGGALALGIGLGGQNLMSSFISSLIIMIERPIKIGDIVEIDGLIGRVNSIGARCISLTNFSNVEILVPNNKVMQNVLVNWTFADHIISNNALLSVPKATQLGTPDEIIALLKKTINDVDGIYKEMPVNVYLTSINDIHYIYQINFSCDLSCISSIELIQSKINIALVSLFKDEQFNVEFLNMVSSKKDHNSDTEKSI